MYSAFISCDKKSCDFCTSGAKGAVPMIMIMIKYLWPTAASWTNHPLGKVDKSEFREMDPLSIIAGVTALLTASVKVGLALNDFYDGTSLVDVKVKGVLTEVDGFSQVLKLVKSSLEEKEIQSSLHSTGHIGEHWDSLSMSIRDGLETVKHLQVTVEKANKSVRLLDAPRRHLRMRGAADEIAVYQQQIRSYKDAMQLSLQVMVLYVLK